MKLSARVWMLVVAMVATGAWAASTTPAVPVAAAASTDWPTYHRDNSRAGYDPNEPLTTATTSAWTTPALDGTIYAEPLLVGNLVIIATEGDSLYAFNADTGAQVWMAHVGTPVTLTNPPFKCWNISPLGITGTPVVDTVTGIVYAVAFETGDRYYLVGRDLATGAEKFPQVLISPAGFDPHFQQQRPALTLASGYIYAAFGGFAGDCGTYHGWVVGVPASGSGTQLVFNDQAGLSTSREAALWATAGPAVDSSGNLFIASGNSNDVGSFNFGETLFKLSPSLARLDYWAPTVWPTLDAMDADLGSAGPLLVGPTSNLVFQIGKSGWGYLVSATSPSSGGHISNGLFSHQVCNAATSQTAANDQVFGGLAYLNPYIYVPCPEGIKAVLLNSSAPSFSVAWSSSSFHAGPPIVAGGVVWALDVTNGNLLGLNPTTGASSIPTVHVGTMTRFSTPTTGLGKILIPTGSRVAAYNLVAGPTSYFPWYDFATPGFRSDYFAVANRGAGAANVLIQLPGVTPLSFSVPAGGSRYVSFPRGTIGGPVTVSTDGQPVIVTQRVLYNQSFSERPALPAAGLGTSLSFPWYDWKTAGFASDYFYVGNPGATAANVTISMPGATSLHLVVAAGRAAFRTFPHGTIGGPVMLSSDRPVLASQRVLYGQSFSEIPASTPASAATQLAFPWYDWKSSAFGSDYFYIANVGAATANVAISLPGAAPINLSVAAGAAAYRTFPHGTIGGPVTVSSDQPVLASQRVLYYQSFTETPASLATSAATSLHFPWYYWAGSEMRSDYLYVANPGAATANVTISLPGVSSIHLVVAAGAAAFRTFPFGTSGGPVTVSSDQPVLASQRNVFDFAFQEFPPPPGW